MLLDINYNYKKKYSDAEVSILYKKYGEFYDEFFDLRQNKSGKFLMQKNLKLLEITLKIDALGDMENRLILLVNLTDDIFKEFVEVRRLEIMKLFREIYPKVKLDLFIEIDELLKLVQQVMKSQINDLDEKTGAKQKAVVKQENTIQYVIAIMSKNLGYKLDPNNMSCIDFIENEKIVSEMNENKN